MWIFTFSISCYDCPKYPKCFIFHQSNGEASSCGFFPISLCENFHKPFTAYKPSWTTQLRKVAIKYASPLNHHICLSQQLHDLKRTAGELCEEDIIFPIHRREKEDMLSNLPYVKPFMVWTLCASLLALLHHKFFEDQSGVFFCLWRKGPCPRCLTVSMKKTILCGVIW